MLNRKLCRDSHDMHNCMYNNVLQEPKSYPTPREYPVLVIWYEEYELEHGRMIEYDYVYRSEFPEPVPFAVPTTEELIRCGGRWMK